MLIFLVFFLVAANISSLGPFKQTNAENKKKYSFFVAMTGWNSKVALHMQKSLFLADCLKVPKREIFSLAFFRLSEPIWIGDLGTGEKIDFLSFGP